VAEAARGRLNYDNSHVEMPWLGKSMMREMWDIRRLVSKVVFECYTSATHSMMSGLSIHRSDVKMIMTWLPPVVNHDDYPKSPPWYMQWLLIIGKIS